MDKSILFCSAGRRARLLMDARKSLAGKCNVVATDHSTTAPALYCADCRYTVPLIKADDYLPTVFDICRDNNVKAITTLIDPEIEILADNFNNFIEKGILPLCPNPDSARFCFNKYDLFKYMTECGIPTPLTFHDLAEFKSALSDGVISFPVFLKPICGSGSVGAHKVNSMRELEADWNSGIHDYIIQEFMTGGDCDADVYVDCVSHKPVAIFSKKKIETRIGGASKTISFKDQKLFKFIEEVIEKFNFNGPLDMDFFFKDGRYYLSEINPRFGGAYIHAYGCGVDFFPLILNNINGIANKVGIGNYENDVLMLMYDDVVIRRANQLVNCEFSILGEDF